MNKQLAFKAMHEQEKLLFLPNAWDVLSALVLEQAVKIKGSPIRKLLSSR